VFLPSPAPSTGTDTAITMLVPRLQLGTGRPDVYTGPVAAVKVYVYGLPFCGCGTP
jgi:hypothetical protein